MPITAIFTTKDTKLTIATTHDALLEQGDAEPRPLTPGENELTVGPGVSRVVSKLGVRVSSMAQDLHVVSLDKAGGPIELLTPLLPSGFTTDDLSTVLGVKSISLD